MNKVKIKDSLDSAMTVGLFVLCFGAVTAGSDGVAGAMTSFLALLISLAVLPTVAISAYRVFDNDERRLWRSVSRVIAVVVSAAALFVVVKAVEGGAELASTVMEIDAPKWIIVSLILVSGGYAAGLGAKAIKKFAIISFVLYTLVSFSLLLLALMREGGADLEHVIPDLIDGVGLVSVKGVSERFVGAFAPAAIAVVWVSLNGKSKRAGAKAAIGTLIGGAVLLMCFVSVVSVIGLDYAAGLPFPYVTAVGAVSVGRLFLRPEGTMYLPSIFSTVAVVAVGISLICSLIDPKGRYKKSLPYTVAVSSLLLWCVLTYHRF